MKLLLIKESESFINSAPRKKMEQEDVEAMQQPLQLLITQILHVTKQYRWNITIGGQGNSHSAAATTSFEKMRVH